MTVRGSVGASPSRSLYGESTVVSVCSLWAIAELSELARLARTACGIYTPGFLGSSPGMTMSPGPTGDTGYRASDECPPRVAPRDRHPRRSRTGRNLTPQSGDPFTMTWGVAPADAAGREPRELRSLTTILVRWVKPKDDDVSWGCRRRLAPCFGRISPACTFQRSSSPLMPHWEDARFTKPATRGQPPLLRTFGVFAPTIPPPSLFSSSPSSSRLRAFA